jgi:radical SAM protein with 4Fe4S-binding SPASM domain
MKELMVYLKTTETCQLNCKHCFTSGSQGRRIFFNPDKTISFFEKLHNTFPVIKNGGTIAFHGGEPMLAPMEDMLKVYRACKNLWDDPKAPESRVRWTIQSNLVYPLTDEKLEFFDEVTGKEQFGTSWDAGIRFPTARVEKLWERNVRTLVDRGYPVTVMVSLTKQAVEKEPKEIIQKMIDLGVQFIAFERVTPNGSARLNDDLAPGNKILDAYLLKMYEQTVEHGFQDKIFNMLLDGVVTSFLSSAHVGERCRNCEQKIFTLNADGTISGCPNSAAEKSYAHVDWNIFEILYSKGRMKEIACEAIRNPICHTCPVRDICNGDCHQLAWEGDICAAPKSLMKRIKENMNSPDSVISLRQYNELKKFKGESVITPTKVECEGEL